MPPASDTSPSSLFDQFVENYEAACGRGLAVSGESRDYFAQQRIAHTRRFCEGRDVRRMLDFGCGLGHSTPGLLEAFPAAALTGVDSSAGAIGWAQNRYGSDRASFVTDIAAIAPGSIDLAYSNGTFHHIEPEERHDIVRAIGRTLAPGGMFALWENNPWNPGTRLVMRRIPFDRDAKPLSYLVAGRLLEGAGMRLQGVSFHFYFPSWLAPLRALESRLERLPLGAQYCVLGAHG